MQPIIDLRSDTVTRPTEEMRRAMAAAEVGDDILRDDPTVLRLEEMAAEVLGKEASIFTVSGTMSNEITAMVLTRPGDEVVAFADSHIYNLETGGLAAISGVQVRPVASTDGLYRSSALREAIMPEGVQRPRTALICLENTFHLNRGLAIPRPAYEPTIREARRLRLPLFMDGARIFNAAAALKCDVKELVDFAEAVAFCLTKGLAAPIGSILAGSRAFVDEARRVKQRLGGGWRQAGVIAAPAIIGLQKMTERLPIDHENAETLRCGLEAMGVHVDRGGILTNIVNADLSPLGVDAPTLAEALVQSGVRVKVCTDTTIRLVAHNDIGPAEIRRTIDEIRRILKP